jgi:hypothetical protein
VNCQIPCLRDSIIPILSTLLVSYFSDLFTRQKLTLAGVDNEGQRRDSLHAIINGLPDPNYATLRALVLVSFLILFFLILLLSVLTYAASQPGPGALDQQPHERRQHCNLLWVSSGYCFIED